LAIKFLAVRVENRVRGVRVMRRIVSRVVRSSVLWLSIAYLGSLLLMAKAYAS